MAKVIDVGLIGFGLAGRVFHAPVIQSVPSLRLKKVVERHGAESRKIYPSVQVVSELADLINDEEIELAVITTPNASHYDIARQCLLANKHVVVEKPFTLASRQAQELIDLAHKQNRIISAHQNRRWDGDFLTVKRLLDGGTFGRLVEYESRFDRFRSAGKPGAWREEQGTGGGVLMDIGTHLIDQAQVLFGLPRMITADIRSQRDFAKVDDNFALTLHYDGLKVTLKAGMLVRTESPRFVLHGTDGSFLKYGLDPQEKALKAGLVPSGDAWGAEPPEQWGTLVTQVGGLRWEGRVETLAGDYPAYYRNVADAINGRAELLVKPEQAQNTIRLVELALESSRQMCSVPFSI